MHRFSSGRVAQGTHEDVVDEIIKCVYESGNNGLVLSRKQCKLVEHVFKAESKSSKTMVSFMRKNREVAAILKAHDNIHHYLEEQLASGKGLQAGILFEYAVVETLARCLGCNKYKDARESMRNIPDAIMRRWEMLNKSRDSSCSARGFYYNPRDKDTMVVQYGNPEDRDASVIVFDHERT